MICEPLRPPPPRTYMCGPRMFANSIYAPLHQNKGQLSVWFAESRTDGYIW
jgi:hypothetical protein